MSAAYDSSADGSVLVGESLANSTTSSERAFRWTSSRQLHDVRRELLDRGVRSVEPRILQSAIEVSDDGTVIVGVG